MPRKKKDNIFDAELDHPQLLWIVFHRKTPKAAPEMMYVTAGVGNALIAVSTFAKEMKVPQKKFDIIAYRPSKTREKVNALQENSVAEL